MAERDQDEPSERRGGLAFAVWAVLALGLHAVLLRYFMRPLAEGLGGPRFDYTMPDRHLWAAIEGLRSHGVAWVYDPSVQAGQPAGLVYEASSEGLAVVTTLLGSHPGATYALGTLVIHAAVPFAGYATARALGMNRAPSAAAALLWVLVWFFDSLAHWLWFTGKITWSAAGLLLPLAVAQAHRAMRRPTWARIAASCVTVAVLVVLHPRTLLLALPVLAVVVAPVVRSRQRHGVVVGLGLAGAIVVAAGAWLWPALDGPHYPASLHADLAPGIETIVFDALGLVHDRTGTGTPARTALRTLCIVAGGIQLVRWRRARDRRTAPLFALAVLGLLIAYAGGHVPGLREAEPYGCVLPVTLALAVLAVPVLGRAFHPRQLVRTTAAGRVLLLAGVVAVVPRFAHAVGQYVPDLLPEPVRYWEEGEDVGSSPLVNFYEPRPDRMAYRRPSKEYAALASWFGMHPPLGRVLSNDWTLVEYLSLETPVPVVGGLEESALPGSDANLFRRKNDGNLFGPALARYFERYAVGVVVLAGDIITLDHRNDVLEHVATVEGLRIYRTRVDVGYALGGIARVDFVEPNAIHVSGATTEVALRFHWLPTLRCRPGCDVRPLPLPGQATPFLRVTNAPERFVIFNSYEWAR